MFEQAARRKLRFETAKGLLSVEDLWDLPLTGKGVNLDAIAVALYAQLKNDLGVSFVNKTVSTNDDVQLKFDIVKHIIDVRMAENQAAATARENAAKKQRILEILNQRQDDALRGASEDELRRMLETM
jgi:hypothetical protein